MAEQIWAVVVGIVDVRATRSLLETTGSRGLGRSDKGLLVHVDVPATTQRCGMTRTPEFGGALMTCAFIDRTVSLLIPVGRRSRRQHRRGHGDDTSDGRPTVCTAALEPTQRRWAVPATTSSALPHASVIDEDEHGLSWANRRCLRETAGGVTGLSKQAN